MNFDYIKIRKQIEESCFAKGLSIEQRSQRIYNLLPTTDENSSLLYSGKNDKDRWQLYFIKEGKSCFDIINNSPSFATIDMILDKYQEIMVFYPIDIKEITDLKHKISLYGSYYGASWHTKTEYWDYSIDLPISPNIVVPLSATKDQKRTERSLEFKTKLAQKSDEYVLQFMLLILLSPSGQTSLASPELDEKALNGVAFSYASPELTKNFPQWYKAWNMMVPTMCQRLQGYWMDAQQEDATQKACGDLTTDPIYRLTKEQQAEIDKENE